VYFLLVTIAATSQWPFSKEKVLLVPELEPK
jgi:hypothetical protein